MTDADIGPFLRLIKMIEHELELAGEGRVAELQEAVRLRGRYLPSLPSPAPAAAVPLLLRARALHARLLIETERLRDGIDESRASLRRARRVARTYGLPRDSRWSTVA